MTGWLDKVAGSILQQDTDTEAGTCFASEKAKPSYLDYFVSSRSIMPIIMGSGMDRTAPFGTHRVVQATLASNPCAVLVPEIKKVKEIPPAVAGVAGMTWEEATRRATQEEPAKESSHPMVKEVLTGHPCAGQNGATGPGAPALGQGERNLAPSPHRGAAGGLEAISRQMHAAKDQVDHLPRQEEAP